MVSPTEWWVTGGNGTGTGDSEVYDVDSSDFAKNVSLPKFMSLHTLIAINETHSMMLGGEPASPDAYFFDGSP